MPWRLRARQKTLGCRCHDDVVLFLVRSSIATRIVHTRSRRQIEATLPFLAEEGLAEDLD